MGLEFISHKNLTIAIIIRSDFRFNDDVNFITKDDDVLQLGYMKRSKNLKLKLKGIFIILLIEKFLKLMK